MTLQTSFPGPSGVVDSVMARKDLAGLVAQSGLFPSSTSPLVTNSATMNVVVGAFYAAIVRGGGPIFIANDGAVNVLLDAAPPANSRIDVIYVMQHENGYGGFADGDNLPTLGVVKGDAAASPVAKAVPAGALALANVTIPSGATATNSSGVVITQVAPVAVLAVGTVIFASAAAMNASSLPDGSIGFNTATRQTFVKVAGAWRPVNGLLTEWHVNIGAGSAGGQPLGPSGSSTLVIPAVSYARAIRITAKGGVLLSSAGDGGVAISPSVGSFPGGGTHRIYSPGGVFSDLSYVWWMASLAANTALTLTMLSAQTVNGGYDLHFTVEEA